MKPSDWYGRASWHALAFRLTHSDKPILVGPFLGEVGFEALYWIPWIRHVARTLGIPKDRLCVIGRSGSGAWYDVPTTVELYDYCDPRDVRIENRERRMRIGLVKQISMSAFDARLLTAIATQQGYGAYHVLHPRWMYAQLAPYWEGRRGFQWLTDRADYQVPFAPTIALDVPVTLPEKFIAVKFYERPTLMAMPDVTAFAKATIQRLAEQWPVVLLNTASHVDDHRDLIVDGPNISTLRDYLTVTPKNTLLAQTIALQRAMGVVGTYGGLLQMASLLGKPVVSFYRDWQATMVAHKHLSDQLAIRANLTFIVHRLSDLPMVQSALPTIRPHAITSTALAPPVGAA